MSLYNKNGGLGTYLPPDNDNNNRRKRPNAKVIIASAVGGGSVVAGIIIAVLITGVLALGSLGLIADSQKTIEDARWIIKYDEVIDPNTVVDPNDVIEPDHNGTIEDNTLPAAYDNSKAYPTPGNQGHQGSCTAWATVYALKSAQDKLDHGWDYNVQPAFSPAFVYNQINHGQDGGSLISEAMKLIAVKGACTLSDMPYKDKDYKTQPTSVQFTGAAPHKAKEWFTVSGLEQIKLAIVKYGGVVVGVNVYDDLDDLDENNQIYDVQSGKNRGGHAVCLVGYDDSKQAFKFINSWGTDWGIDGFGWVSYSIVVTDTQLYGAFSMEDAEENN